MFNVILVNPAIPPNTGNIIRLCANSGSTLHIIEPIGFTLDNKKMKRAGLDYHEIAIIQTHRSWEHFLERENPEKKKLYALSTHGKKLTDMAKFDKGAWLVFGSETTGLSKTLLEWIGDEQTFRIPMRPGNRSLNLANAVAVTIYEAWRQHSYLGGI